MRYQKWLFTFVLKTSISKLALRSGLLITEKVYQIIAQVEPELWWMDNYGVTKYSLPNSSTLFEKARCLK